MYFDMNGVTFTRLQRSGAGAIGDPLAPDVLFDGRFLGGFCMFKTLSVSVPNNVSSSDYTVSYGRTFANPPIIFGMLRTSQAYVDGAGNRWFEANEFVSPCIGTYKPNGQVKNRNFEFTYLAYNNQVVVTVGGFVGTVSLLIVELD